MQSKIKLYLVEDHRLLRESFKKMLDDENDFRVLKDLSDGQDLFETLEIYKQHPDIILLDLQMPRMNGKQALIKIKEKYPEIKIIILSLNDSSSSIKELMRMGANAYIDKNADPKELFDVIREVYSKGFSITSKVTNALLNKTKPSTTANFIREELILASLSNYEISIIKLICNELTNDEIANYLSKSTRAIETARRRIMDKINVKNAAGVAKFAIANNIIEL